MALIRSEHINDQAVREAKDAVTNAENALEDARAQLEKRERAQYHEEQIWSDTIRRNSTWVTFGLMGVNIFLLLLSLAILEPWRRRRMVREIKNTLEAHQKLAMDAATPSYAAAAVAPAPTTQGLAAIEEEIDRVVDRTDTPAKAATPVVPDEVIEESPTAGTNPVSLVEPKVIPEVMPEATSTVPEVEPLTPEEEALTPKERIAVAKESAPSHTPPSSKLENWQQKASYIAHDIVSDRVISMRRIDYTSAILQGAAAGAVITASIIAMLRPN
jgi:sensitive to high expression protein 9